MKRTIEIQVEIDKDGNYDITSYEPESGNQYPVDAGNIHDIDDTKFEQKVGLEVLSWIECWVEALEDEE